MTRTATQLFGVLLALSLSAAAASAYQYPPGPPYRTCPNPPTIYNIQQPDTLVNPCHPVPTDSVFGARGIITGFDNNGSGRGFYFQTRNNPPAAFTGIDVFSGGISKPGLALGDSVEVSGKVEEFQGGTEISGFDNSNATDDLVVTKISSGNTMPDYHIGTVAELRELGSATSEQWEGMLVKIRQTLRVARISVPFASTFLAVLNTCTIGCDSVYVDGGTLGSPVVNAPPVGTVIDSVQGIYEERQRAAAPSFRIQLRNGADLFAAVPPNMADAFSIEDDQVRVIFDRPVTQATAENINNYSMLIGQVDAAQQPTAGGPEVILTVSGYPADGITQSVTAENIASASSGLLMGPQTRSYFQGVMTVAAVQAADPNALAGTPCEDRSRFAGAGNQVSGNRVTFRGVVAAVFNDQAFLSDESGALRGGLVVFRPNTTMVQGRKYRVAGVIQEFFGATEAVQGGTSPFYITDEGVGTIPAPALQTVHVLADSACDATGLLTTGEDYEGMLVKAKYVKVVDRLAPSPSPPVGGFFDVAGENPAFTDSMNVDNLGTYTYDPNFDDVISVTGILHWSFGQFRINPRDDKDILFHGVNIGVSGTLPGSVKFSVHPNPARTARISWALPQRSEVDLGIFDVAGRRIVTIAKGAMEAGVYSREWNGLRSDGTDAAAGLYFYRLRVGDQLYKLTGVKLK